jgi:citrate synthase
MVGWLAQWRELLEDPEQKIARPRQIYTGRTPETVGLAAQVESAPVAV